MPTAATDSPVPPRYVTLSELHDALGISRSTLLRRIAERKVPEAVRTEGGETGVGHRRWKVATARAIVRRAGKAVPAAWGGA